MILAVDAHYQGNTGFVAGVAFSSWVADEAEDSYLSSVQNVGEYEPGKFYKRELPCIMRLLEEHSLKPDTIVIDGFVYLDDKGAPGLGHYLFEAVDRRTEVIGVAKKHLAIWAKHIKF